MERPEKRNVKGFWGEVRWDKTLASTVSRELNTAGRGKAIRFDEATP